MSLESFSQIQENVDGPLFVPVEEILPGLTLTETELSQIQFNGNPYSNDFISGQRGMDIISVLKKIDKFPILLRNNLNGQVLVDIGAGSSAYGGYEIASDLGAKGYIAIEPYHERTLRENIISYVEEYGDKPRVKTAILSEPAQMVIKKIPEKSASFLISGIDHTIMSKKDIDSIFLSIITKLSERGIIIINATPISTDCKRVILDNFYIIDAHNGRETTNIDTLISGESTFILIPKD